MKKLKSHNSYKHSRMEMTVYYDQPTTDHEQSSRTNMNAIEQTSSEKLNSQKRRGIDERTNGQPEYLKNQRKNNPNTTLEKYT